MPKSPIYRLPTDKERHIIVGATGSGKTIAGLYYLSLRSYDFMPWVIFDFKRDDNIAAIPYAQYIDYSTVPTAAGIYILRPGSDDGDQLSDYFKRLWAHENIGIYIDEGMMVTRPGRINVGLRDVLTQGRSKHIPVIILSQRPVSIDRSMFTEADFIQVFRLQSDTDVKTVQDYVRQDIDPYDENGELRLPEHHSYYADIKQNVTIPLQPVPPIDHILPTFNKRLAALYKSGEDKAGRKFLNWI